MQEMPVFLLPITDYSRTIPLPLRYLERLPDRVSLCVPRYHFHYHFVTILMFSRRMQGVSYLLFSARYLDLRILREIVMHLAATTANSKMKKIKKSEVLTSLFYCLMRVDTLLLLHYAWRRTMRIYVYLRNLGSHTCTSNLSLVHLVQHLLHRGVPSE